MSTRAQPHARAHGADPPTVTIARHEDGWQLSCTQWVEAPRDEVFPFFGSARNLERLTPDFLRFRILRAPTDPLRTGSSIVYRLRLHGLPVWWRTQIAEWDPPLRFVDVQVSGPFRLWRHLHRFDEQDGGTLVVDEVTFDVFCRPLYRTPVLGWIDSDLRRIFEYRHAQIARLFAGRSSP